MDQIAQTRHKLSTRATADATAVFIKGDISDPVEAVFNGPMRAAESEDTFGIGTLCGHAGDSVNSF